MVGDDLLTKRWALLVRVSIRNSTFSPPQIPHVLRADVGARRQRIGGSRYAFRSSY